MKTLYRFRFVLLAITGAALIAAMVWTLHTNSRPDVAGHLGPTPGPSSEGHIKAQRAYLDRIARADPNMKAAALVSLKSYVSAAEAEAIAKSMHATVVFVRLPASQQELQFVRTTITGAVADRSASLRRDLTAEIAQLEAQVTKAKGKERTTLQSLVTKRKADLAKVKTECACVFAFAVEGASLNALDALAKLPEVRLVDVPQPVTASLAGWELGPIVPKAQTV